MPLTKSFNDLVQKRAANDPEFAAALLRDREAAGCAAEVGILR
jgi:hypothetical protein